MIFQISRISRTFVQIAENNAAAESQVPGGTVMYGSLVRCHTPGPVPDPVTSKVGGVRPVQDDGLSPIQNSASRFICSQLLLEYSVKPPPKARIRNQVTG